MQTTATPIPIGYWLKSYFQVLWEGEVEYRIAGLDVYE